MGGGSGCREDKNRHRPPPAAAEARLNRRATRQRRITSAVSGGSRHRPESTRQPLVSASGVTGQTERARREMSRDRLSGPGEGCHGRRALRCLRTSAADRPPSLGGHQLPMDIGFEAKNYCIIVHLPQDDWAIGHTKESQYAVKVICICLCI